MAQAYGRKYNIRIAEKHPQPPAQFVFLMRIVRDCALFCRWRRQFTTLRLDALISYKQRRPSSQRQHSVARLGLAEDQLTMRSRPQDTQALRHRSALPSQAALLHSANPPAGPPAEAYHISPSAQIRAPGCREEMVQRRIP